MADRLSMNGNDWLFKDFLGEDWIWRNSEKPDTRDVRWWRSGSVPGSVHHDLWALGEIPDPYFERNSLLIEWVPERTWIYKKTFVPAAEWRGRRVRLHFEGIDYEAQVFLNGKRIGHHKGMYTPAVFEVSNALRFGEDNLLAVVIERAPDEQPQVSKTEYVKTHKSRMTYWWDFCPRMIHIGIWDDVYLEASGPAVIDDVFVRPDLSGSLEHANLAVSVRLNSTEAVLVELQTAIYDSGRVVAEQSTRHALTPGVTDTNALIALENPKLWWPNGYGDQPLYEARVTVRPMKGSADSVAVPECGVSHDRSVTFGIRKIELAKNENSSPDAAPYTFIVNGQRIYVKGWNWVPIDVMYGVPRPEKLERLLTLAKRANVNMLRVWGGGLIEKEAFYDWCDRFGILVWQEFIQSSSGIANKPSEDPAFIEMMVNEAEEIIPRKRNHPSLALWCGGNELQGPGDVPLDNREPVLGALAEAVRRLDPDRHWLPTSPTGPLFSNSLENIEANPLGLHDVHGPWEHQGLTGQYTLYNKGTSLFHSEFGVEGMTNRRTLDLSVSEANQWPPSRDNPVYFHRGSWWINEVLVQRSFGSNIGDIGTMIRASQLLQAEGLRYAVESNRRRKYQNSGTLPWQFNEPYPNNYCTSAIDYYANPKPVYYAVSRAYRATSVTASFATQAWLGYERFESELWVTRSEQLPLRNARLTAQLIGASGAVYASESWKVDAEGGVSTRIGSFGAPVAGAWDEVFYLDLLLADAEGEEIAVNRYPFVRTETLEPLLDLPETMLDVRQSVSGSEWTLEIANTGGSAALLVWLEDDRPLREAEDYVYFDDNHFHLLPGEKRKVRVYWHGTPEAQRKLTIGGWNTAATTIG